MGEDMASLPVPPVSRRAERSIVSRLFAVERG